MELKRAAHLFQFVTQAHLIELTGIKVRQLDDLAAYLKTASHSVVYHHTHHFLKQHQFLSPEPPNDFAYWVSNVLQEDRLGEQLAAIDTVQFSSIESLRQALVQTIEKFLVTTKTLRVAPEGDEFHFMKSRSFIFPIPYQAGDLKEFSDCISKVSIYSLYHHIFEARLRLGRGTNDFSNWLETELGEKDLAFAINRLDPYTHTLQGLRQKISHLLQRRLSQWESVHAY